MWRQHRLAARAGIAAGALVAAAVVLPASLASWADVGHPQLAAKIAPWNAPAAADAAAALGTDPRKPEARALVRRALARDLTQVQAIEQRALDEALSGNSGRARRLFALSDRLSRRSLPTRLWLIQDAVDRGNVAGALRNFDIALRTTTDAQPILFPVLAKAAADPTLTNPLARSCGYCLVATGRRTRRLGLRLLGQFVITHRVQRAETDTEATAPDFAEESGAGRTLRVNH